MSYFANILIGLHYLHSKKIVHKDFKPGNIFVQNLRTGVKILKIGDFGCSKIESNDPLLETPVDCKTTLAYLAPEKITPVNEKP